LSDGSDIEWTDATWNPVTGCTKVSAGCDNCYAATLAARLQRMGSARYKNGFKVTLHPDVLELPLKWKQPRRIFVNSMSDLFHRDVPDEYVRKVFDVMRRADWHQFQVLTKRPQRLARMAPTLPWPSNVWQGVSVENNDVSFRADLLRKVPAAVRFISFEPLIGPVDKVPLDGIDWAIAGGESGHGARPMEKDWVADLLRRCRKQRVAFFFKQWGGRTHAAGGRTLNGRTYDFFPTPRPVTVAASANPIAASA
jgi:protein gp37